MEITTEPMNPRARFRGQVLGQIYRIWLFRKLLPVLLLEIAVFAFILYQLGRLVFLQRIIENWLNVFFLNPGAAFSYSITAFFHASSAAQILGIIAAVLLALVLRHFTQGILRFVLVKKNYFRKIEAK